MGRARYWGRTMKILIKGDGVTGVRRTKTYGEGDYSAIVTTEPTRTWWERFLSYLRPRMSNSIANQKAPIPHPSRLQATIDESKNLSVRPKP